MKTAKWTFSIYSLLFLLILSSCNHENDDKPKTTPYVFPTIKNFPTNLNIPVDNPMTVEGVKLGKYLFYDGRISGRTDCDSMFSCYKCHEQKRGFTTSNIDGKGVGVLGIKTPHDVMSLVNLVYRDQSYYGWSGQVQSIESVASVTFLLANEFATTHEIAVEAIQNIPMYPPLFKAAFGTDKVTIELTSKAIAQFIRSLVSYNSKYDKFVRHEVSLTPSESRGYTLFMSEKGDCFHCHGNPVLLTTNRFYNNAKDTLFPGLDDRFSVTGNPMEKGSYIAPTLRNIALKAAYMHDGRYKTLEEVIDHYSDGLMYSQYVDPLMKWVAYGGTELTQTEKDDLLAFLQTFTDNDFITNPEFARPADLKTGCPE